ncbi:MAG: MFS transporter, partial [Ilumatobacteraceae bacterium]
MLSVRREPYVASGDRLISGPFVVVTTVAFFFFLYIGMLIPVVPLFIEGPLAAGELGIGINVAVFATAAILARPVIGRIADRRGRRLVIVVGALLAGVGGALSGQVDSLAALLPLRALTGIGEAAVFVGAATLITDLSPRDRRAEGASYFSIAVFSGLGFGPILGELLLDDTMFERAFAAAGLSAFLGALIALAAPARVVSPDDDPNGGESAPNHGWRRFVHPAALEPGLVLACGVGGLMTFFAFVPEYSRSIGMSASGGLFLAYALVSLVIRIFGAKLPERLGPRRMVTIALTLIAAGLLLIAAVPRVPAMWVGAVLIGAGVAFNFPSLLALTVNRVGDHERARAVSSFTMFFEIGSAIGGLTIGAFAQIVGKQTGFLGGVASCLIGLWLLRTKVVPADAPDAGPMVPD